MTAAELIYAQAMAMSGELSEAEQAMLATLSSSAGATLAGRLREGVETEDCLADFVAAGSLMALAAMSEIREAGQPERFKAGDLTVQKKGSTAAANCLRQQAKLMMMPYLREPYAFLGV